MKRLETAALAARYLDAAARVRLARRRMKWAGEGADLGALARDWERQQEIADRAAHALARRVAASAYHNRELLRSVTSESPQSTATKKKEEVRCA